MNDVRYTIVSDHLGSVRQVMNSQTGEMLQEQNFEAFGMRQDFAGEQVVPFGFAGGLYDEDTGLIRFGARDYDPHSGRWTTKDPIRFDGDALNLYRYANNDPVNNIDPSGLLDSPDGPIGSGQLSFDEINLLFVLPDSGSKASKHFPKQDPVGTQRDAFRHCVASCTVAQAGGSTLAHMLGDAWEFGDTGSPECAQDYKNNSVGRSLSTDKSMGENCSQRCVNAVANGMTQNSL